MNLLIWGAGQHAAVIEEAVQAENRRHGRWNRVVKKADPDPDDLSKGYVIFGFGDMPARLRHAEKVTAEVWYPSLVHPRAYVADEEYLDLGTFLAAGSVVGVNAAIGRHCIVNTCASVDHDCVLADAVHVCPGARLCGRVKIGKGTVIGAGAVVVPGVEIGEFCRIDAGAVVTENVPDNSRVESVKSRIHRLLGFIRPENDFREYE